MVSRLHKEKEESVEPPYVLCINCSESHALGIQILTNVIAADMGWYGGSSLSSFSLCTLDGIHTRWFGLQWIWHVL